MTITPEGAARALLERATERFARIDARRAVLRSHLPALATMLRTRYGAKRVILFGSLAWGGFHAESDVDVAVEGVSTSDAAAARADADDVMNATVELFRLEALPASFRDRIVQEGTTLP